MALRVTKYTIAISPPALAALYELTWTRLLTGWLTDSFVIHSFARSCNYVLGHCCVPHSSDKQSNIYALKERTV